MFIIEGTDGSGKTTLAEQLSRTTRKEIFHSGGPPDNSIDACKRTLEQAEKFGQILDRNIHISEIVYGNILREKPIMPEEYLLDNFKKLFIQEHPWILIYCRPNFLTIGEHTKNLMQASKHKTYKTEEHIIAVQSQAFKIYEEYDRIINKIRKMGMPILIYNRDAYEDSTGHFTFNTSQGV